MGIGIIAQRSAVQIRPRNHERHCRNAVAFACFAGAAFVLSRAVNTTYLTIQIDEELGTRVIWKLEAKNAPMFGTSANDSTNTDSAPTR